MLRHGLRINVYIRVRVKGIETDLPRGTTVGQAVAQPGVPANFRIRKLHDGRLYPVIWDRATPIILNLPLEGGEELAW